ncbi:MAG TPA: NRDE family protein, partial [Flavobacteriaceae bacterium]|nr:NRDE family protein [Flavobacteriaceae bacterium]
MCTLTYIPNLENNRRFMLVDNRDEAVNRPAAFPQVYKELDTQLFYPKDIQAGGTWFGISIKKRAMALMNGAFKRHERKITYPKSRGLVVKELLAANNLKQTIDHYNFEEIEAFYGVIFSWNDKIEILEVIWDGEELHLNKKDPTQPHIWSSAMTFSPQEHEKKKLRFEELIEKNFSYEELQEKLWEFHQSKEAGMILDYGTLKTTSISRFIK